MALRDFVYLLYAAYITLQAIAFAALFSSFYRLLWPEIPYIQNHLYFFAQAMSLATGTAFFRVFMDLPTRKPGVSNFVLGVSIVSFLIAFGTLLSSQNVIFSRSLTAIYFLWIPVFLVLTIGEITRGRVDMWMFMLVWGAVYLAGILYMLSSAGIIPYHGLLFLGPTILFPFDAVFFLVTLYQRYRSIESARSQLEREMKSTLARLANESRNKADKQEKGKYPRSKLAGMDIGEKLAKLDQILRVEKAFKKEDLTLAELADRIGVTPHQLSEMCNAQLNTSFPRLLAYHRVREATDLLLQGELNILQIAFEAGFASKSAFNIEFKRVTGLTPREYRSQSRPNVWEPEDLKTGT
ncbi:MAG: helix-turn-helix domain-containing protein [Leptospirales bacterium]|nr:helix-turn-helix domain-containing protein [Leptospirales bacterium]